MVRERVAASCRHCDAPLTSTRDCKSKRAGLCGRCFKRLYDKAYREQHKAQYRAYAQRYYQANRETLRERNTAQKQAWREVNRQHYREYQRAYKRRMRCGAGYPWESLPTACAMCGEDISKRWAAKARREGLCPRCYRQRAQAQYYQRSKKPQQDRRSSRLERRGECTMSVIAVESTKCNGDGLCVAECPAHIIELAEDSIPIIVDGADDRCIDCGHCVAVCPTGALSHRTTAPADCPPVTWGHHVGPELIENLLRSRRSIRVYKDRLVDRELLARLIDIARHAPSSHNDQQVGWLVVYDPDDVRRLAGLTIDYMRDLVKRDHPYGRAIRASELVAAWDVGIDRIANGAPHMIVTHAPTKHPFTAAECAMALNYVDLAALPLGLGTCYLGYLWNAWSRWTPLQEALDLPAGHSLLGAMAIGYPRFKYHRIPPRKEAQITWR